MQAGKGNCKENESRIREIIQKIKAGKGNNEENEGNGRFVYTKRPFVTKSLLFGCLGPVTYGLNPFPLPEKQLPSSRPGGPLEAILKL